VRDRLAASTPTDAGRPTADPLTADADESDSSLPRYASESSLVQVPAVPVCLPSIMFEQRLSHPGRR